MSNKRMIYVWDENLAFYDSLENKSDFINRLLKAENAKRNQGPVVDPNMAYVQAQIAAMDARHKGQ